METLANFGHVTGIYRFMNSAWGWPIAESLHFLGMCLVIGTIGVFDLRLLGVGKGIAVRDLHSLVPFGVAGYLLNVATGIMFLSTAPDQYLYNPAFQTKLLFMGLAGINMLAFYALAASPARATPAASTVPAIAAISGAISLACWTTVIIGGRLITYFRPPYHWCFWCG